MTRTYVSRVSVYLILCWFACYARGLVFCADASCELKNWRKWDDALDVWGVHGMGGALGSVLIGVFADKILYHLVCHVVFSADSDGSSATVARSPAEQADEDRAQ